jgi:hypothetical protein
MSINISNHSLDTNSKMLFQFLGIFFLASAILLAVAIVSELTHRVVVETTLFDTDEASHAIPVLELYVAAQRRDIAHFSRAVIEQSFYPPVHSLTVLPSYLIAGPSLATTRMPTVITFVLLIIAAGTFTFHTTSKIEDAGRGATYISTAVAIFFVSTSPVLLENSVLCMLELIGCLWIVLLLWLCWSLEHSSSNRWTRACLLAVALLVITLTKYTFGVFAIPAIVAAILTRQNPRHWKWSQLTDAIPVLVVLAIGLGFWFVIAGFGGALYFAFDQPKYAPLFSVDNFLFYPQAWLNNFHLHPIFGIFTALLACWGAIKRWNSFAVRTASWIACFSLLILTISLNNQPRHFAIAGPCIWFLAALGLTHLLALSAKVSYSRFIQPIFLILIFAFMSLTAFQRADELQPMLTYSFEGRDSDRIIAMNSFILDHVDLGERLLILGLFDQFNALAIRWQIAIDTKLAPSEIIVDNTPPNERNNEASGDESGNTGETMVLKEAASQGLYSQIVVIQGVNSTNLYILAASDALRDYQSTRKLFDDYRIDIFDLK